jgi:surfactin family lipopeptide synthetase A
MVNSSIGYNTPLEEHVNIFPASFAQQRLWFLDQLESDSAAYNVIAHLRLKVPLDVEELEQSLDAIIQRHQVLRTAIMAIEGQPMQIILPFLALSVPIVDLQHLPEAERENETLRLATEEAQRPFDLSQSPLMRTTLLRLGHEDYLLLVSMHRIISDEWSIRQFCQELAVHYEAFLCGQPSPFTTLPIQYADYTLQQKEWLQGDMLASQLAYWKKQLENIPAVLTLPTDRPRLAVRTYRGAVQPFALTKRLTDDLKVLSCQEGVTLYMTLVAACQALLQRYTGQDDIFICSPIAGRTRSETENVIGTFINKVVLRTDLSDNPTFRELLKRVRSVILEAQAHQDVPFEYLIKELQLERNLAQNPHLQVMLVLEPPSPTLPSGWTLTQMNLKTRTSEFDLTLVLDDRPGGLIGRFEYRTDLFDAATINRMVGHWQTLLESIVAGTGQSLGELPLLTQEEQRLLLVEWNSTDAEYPKDNCIHQFFESQVERTPDAVAGVFEERCLTYRELNRKSNQLAHFLQRLGVGPEVLVGIYVERSLEMVVGLLGILKAGGAFVPLDPAYPPERLTFMLEDAQVSVLVTEQRLAQDLPEHEAQVVCLDTDWEAIAQQSVTDPINEVLATNLAYVMYTSGSTGKPKGVMITQQNLMHSTWARLTYYHTPVKALLLLSSFAFDISVAGIFWTLCTGGMLVLPRQGLEQDTLQIAEEIAHRQISHILCIPALYSLLLVQATIQQLKSLVVVIVGGEACPAELPEHHYRLLPDTTLFNEYGPTECTVWSSVYKLRSEDRGSTISIGRPIANTQIYLLDALLQSVPIGVPGEIYIGGDGVARGYLNRPELTAERFIPNPFNQKPDALLYKSGDLALYLPEGNIEFLMRIDDQVKFRGYRIELGEIEGVLCQHPAVSQAVVMVREDTSGDKRVVAYIVTVQGQTPAIKSLRSYLKEKLPAYMVPSVFMLLDALPLTPTSKVERRALPEPQWTEGMTEETYVPPTMMVHYQLIQIWEELLVARPIGIRDNFFDLGGHSLLAILLTDRIEQFFRKRISLSTLFAGPTIEQLANALLGEDDTGSRVRLVTVQVGVSKRPFFFLHGDWTGGAFYCFPLARELGSDQPFYAFEPYRFDNLPVPPTVETVAAAHILSLRAVQPEGPYLLGGWCNGGLVAYEMARQLHAAGQTVDLLVLMDPMYLGSGTRLRLLRVVIDHVGNLIGLGMDKQLDLFLCLLYVYRPLRSMVDALLLVYTRLRNVRYESSQDSVRLIINDMIRFARQKVMTSIKGFARKFEHERVVAPRAEALREDYTVILDWIGMGYKPPSLYPGKITFFWPSKEPWHTVSWRKVTEAQEGEVYVIPGSQDSWKAEHLHALAERLSMCLSKVQDRSAVPSDGRMTESSIDLAQVPVRASRLY